MSNGISAGSIVSELDEKLDNIFGKEEDSFSFEENSIAPLAELKGLMLTIDWEISDETILAFDTEVEQLKRLFVGESYAPPLLKMLSSLTAYLKAKKGDARPETLTLFQSVFDALGRVVEEKSLPPQAKKSIVDTEILKFKDFKKSLMAPPKAKPSRTRLVETRPARNVRPEPTGVDEPRMEMEPHDDLTSEPFNDLFGEQEEDGIETVHPNEAVQSSPAPVMPDLSPIVEELRGFLGAELGALKNWADEFKVEFGQVKEDAVKTSRAIEDIIHAEPVAQGADHTVVVNELREYIADELKGLKQNLDELKSDLRTREAAEAKAAERDLEISAVPAFNGAAILDGVRDYLGGELNALKAEFNGLTQDFGQLKELVEKKDSAPREESPSPTAAESSAGAAFTGMMDEIRSCIGNEFSCFKTQMESLKSEFDQIRDDMGSVKSALDTFRKNIEDSSSAVHVSAANDAEELRFLQDPAEPERVEEMNPELDDLSLTEEAPLFAEPDFDGFESTDPSEELVAAEETHENELIELYEDEPGSEEEIDFASAKESENAEGGDEYFVFELGGKRYAVEERFVIKASKCAAMITKKARKKGSLTILDCKPRFSGIRRDLQPAWSNLSNRELKGTKFSLIDGVFLDGLSEAAGGGVLFLGSGPKRAILLTDDFPKKERLSVDAEAHNDSGSMYVAGALKTDPNDESCFLLDAEKML